MISEIISRLIVLFMLICIYNCTAGIGKKDKKRALIWGALFLLTGISIYVLYRIAANS
jgi:hypothetical protein